MTKTIRVLATFTLDIDVEVDDAFDPPTLCGPAAWPQDIRDSLPPVMAQLASIEYRP